MNLAERNARRERRFKQQVAAMLIGGAIATALAMAGMEYLWMWRNGQ